MAGVVRAMGSLVLGAALVLGASRAAADTEYRDFTVTVDGKPAGAYRMAIEQAADGTVRMAAKSEVRVTVLKIPVYTYTYEGQEVWKDGRLQSFACRGKEDGKAFAVGAVAGGGALSVTANGRAHTARPDVWLTSVWQLPAARGPSVVLLGCDSGAETPAVLQDAGPARLTVAGAELSCAHYRLLRDVPYDLWYDGQGRLVRQEWTSPSGHRTVIDLAAKHN